MPKKRRNTAGLRQSARKRHDATCQRARAAISSLQQESKAINFRTVSKAARVSTAWLYSNPETRAQIERFRSLRTAQVTIKETLPASDRSKDSIITALKLRTRELEEENRQLKSQMEVALWQLCSPQRPADFQCDLVPEKSK